MSARQKPQQSARLSGGFLLLRFLSEKTAFVNCRVQFLGEVIQTAAALQVGVNSGLFTGLREAEAVGLTWDVVDFKSGTIKVCKQLQRRPGGNFAFAPLKNNKTRTLKPAPFVISLLERRKREQTAQKLKAGPLWQG